ncbi:MAG: IS110 family transposase [Deltaproteobacteria bacterium]|nr:IS110 family transposase [Deltaproteobacteria bacterium]
MKYYIAIDVSKEVLSVFDGKKDLTFKNERGLRALKSYLKEKFETFDDVVIIFESTGPYSNYLKKFCATNQIKTCIINPKRSSNFAKAIGNRSKTDKIDAKTLYAFKNLINPGDIKVPEIDKDVEVLSAYLSSYEFVLKTRISISNHIEALEHNDAPKKLLSTLKQEFKRNKQLEGRLLNKTEKHIEKNKELKEDYHNLLTIPGIGKISAIALLYLFKNYKDTNRSQITALVGLDPTRKESGTSISGRRKISKNGNGTVRKILYFPTLTAINYNKRIKTVYERLINNHKSKKVALIAAMRKLVLIAHAVYKNKVEFSIA